MTLKLLTKACLVIGILIISVFADGVSAHAESLSWENPTLYNKTVATSTSMDHCTGSYQPLYLWKDGVIVHRTVCMKSGAKLGIGSFYEPGEGWIWVVKLQQDRVAYTLRCTCSYRPTGDCFYIPSRDMFVMRPGVPQTYISSMGILENVTQRLSFQGTEAELDSSNIDYIYKNASGYTWPVGGIGVSENGDWISLEFMQRGIGLLNLNTFEMKRLSTEFIPQYWVGSDPATQMTVSNDGKYIAMMGSNVSLVLLNNTDDCGDEATDDNMQDVSPPSKQCHLIPLAPYTGLSGRLTGFNPKFDEVGGELDFLAQDSINTYSLALRAGDYTPKRLDYLALGDSYSSGEGETDDNYYIQGTNLPNNKCHVSSRSYPFVLAGLQGLNLDSVKSVACSGATTENIIGNSATYPGQLSRVNDLRENSALADEQAKSKLEIIPGRLLQEDFVKNYTPKAVTVGIGGNDIDLVGHLLGCITGTCSVMNNPNERAQFAQEIKDSFGQLVSTYTKLANDSPESQVYAIGYPQVVSTNDVCRDNTQLFMGAPKRQFVHESISYLNQVIQAAAEAAGVPYVDISDALGDHNLCGADTPAVNSVRLGDDTGGINELFDIIGNESFHPNPLGNQLVAHKINDHINNLTSYKYCQGSTNYCPDSSITPPEPPDYWGADLADTSIFRQASQFTDQVITDVTSELKSIAVDSFTFQPSSSVKIEIMSDPVDLGSYSTDQTGGLTTDVDLPDNLEPGYHTIHLYGTSYSGQAIDIYQTVQYQPQTANPSNGDTGTADDSSNTTPDPDTTQNQDINLTQPTPQSTSASTPRKNQPSKVTSASIFQSKSTNISDNIKPSIMGDLATKQQPPVAQPIEEKKLVTKKAAQPKTKSKSTVAPNHLAGIILIITGVVILVIVTGRIIYLKSKQRYR